jgi:integrase
MTTTTSANEKRKMKRKLDDLTDKTRADYMRLSEHFYETRMDGQPPTPKRISDALRASALEYRPAYWRKLRNAITYNQIERGHFDSSASVKSVYNPVTSPKTAVDRKMSESVGAKPGKAQKRLKKLSQQDLAAIIREAGERDDYEAASALIISSITGARPAEMLNIQCLEKDIIFIEGAKKTEKGDRGLDRYLQVTPKEWRLLNNAVTALRASDPGKAGTMHKVQSRVSTMAKALWPRRKTRLTLYTMRYAMGSDLKASGLSRQEIAYVMGHQSMQSVDKYGNRRSGSGKTPIKPAPGADMSGVREGFKTPFQQSPGRQFNSQGLGMG